MGSCEVIHAPQLPPARPMFKYAPSDYENEKTHVQKEHLGTDGKCWLFITSSINENVFAFPQIMFEFYKSYFHTPEPRHIE